MPNKKELIQKAKDLEAELSVIKSGYYVIDDRRENEKK